ncbi:hypothetical protein, partial [Klebsiella pneumoniae]|uniref:hypothetical protein n=1 Tax=Klebsiella pneumoniae TaxID=573 RepID=UPI00210918BF
HKWIYDSASELAVVLARLKLSPACSSSRSRLFATLPAARPIPAAKASEGIMVNSTAVLAAVCIIWLKSIGPPFGFMDCWS